MTSVGKGGGQGVQQKVSNQHIFFLSRALGTGTVLVLAPCIFGSPFPGTGTVLVPTKPVPSVLH